MDAATVSTLLVAVLGGSALTEVIRAFRDRKKSNQDLTLQAIEAIYPKMKADVERLEGRILVLEHVIVALSNSLAEAGIDPLPVRVKAEVAAMEQQQN